MHETSSRQNVAAETWQFLRLWARNPMGIGAVVPSGSRLACAMADALGPLSSGVVVELGAGTGRITRALIDRAATSAGIVVVEREESFCSALAKRFPQTRILQGDARDLRRLTAQAGVGEIAHVVSSLPLLSMTTGLRSEIATEVFAALGPRGRFVQFTYGPRSPVPRDTVERAGFVATRASWVLRNVPPAAVWVYTRAED